MQVKAFTCCHFTHTKKERARSTEGACMLRTQADTHQSRLDPDLDVLQSNKGKVEGLLHALKCITTAHIWGVGGGAPPLLCTLHSVPRMCVCCSICYWCVLSPYAMALHAAARLGLQARQTEKEDNDCLFLPPKTDPPTPHHTSGVDSHSYSSAAAHAPLPLLQPPPNPPQARR